MVVKFPRRRPGDGRTVGAGGAGGHRCHHGFKRDRARVCDDSRRRSGTAVRGPTCRRCRTLRARGRACAVQRILSLQKNLRHSRQCRPADGITSRSHGQLIILFFFANQSDDAQYSPQSWSLPTRQVEVLQRVPPCGKLKEADSLRWKSCDSWACTIHTNLGACSTQKSHSVDSQPGLITDQHMYICAPPVNSELSISNRIRLSHFRFTLP